MTKKNSLKLAPYDSNGNLMKWSSKYPLPGTDFRPNDPFTVTRMQVVSMERGMSAARFILEDQTTSARYPMFMSSMLHLVQNSVIQFGEIWDREWIVVKKGQNYGIELYERDEA